jgi:hypothetical protein
MYSSDLPLSGAEKGLYPWSGTESVQTGENANSEEKKEITAYLYSRTAPISVIIENMESESTYRSDYRGCISGVG